MFDNGTALQALLILAAEMAPHAEMISAGTLAWFVESLRWSPKSGVRAPATAFPRKRAREISRPGGDVGAEATLVGASAQPVPRRLRRRRHRSFGAIPAIDALRSRPRILGTAASPERIAVGRQPNPGRALMVFAARTPAPQARSRLSNGLALTRGRPSAADRRVQRHVRPPFPRCNRSRRRLCFRTSL